MRSKSFITHPAASTPLSDRFLNFDCRWFRELRSQNFCWVLDVGCMSRWWFLDWHGLNIRKFCNVLFIAKIFYTGVLVFFRKQSFVNKFTLKRSLNKLFLYWWVPFFPFFCLDAKEPKNQVGKSSAKKRYSFLKIPELERWLRLRSATISWTLISDGFDSAQPPCMYSATISWTSFADFRSVLSDRIRLVCAQPDRVCELRFRMASTPLSHRVWAQWPGLCSATEFA